jgi:hypothetical protein
MIVHRHYLYNSYLGYHDSKELVSLCWAQAVGWRSRSPPPPTSGSLNAERLVDSTLGIKNTLRYDQLG